jgi:predicted nucleic acid-binding protein
MIDTNVVLSALVFAGGEVGQMRLAWQSGLVVSLASTATVQELLRVLARPKFLLSPAEQDELLADYQPYAETVRIPKPLPSVPDFRDVLAIIVEFERVNSCPILNLDTFCKMHVFAVRK